MFTHQLNNGDAFNGRASWWRMDQNGVQQPGATWFLLPKWPHADGSTGRPAVVDDYGTLVPVEWRS